MEIQGPNRALSGVSPIGQQLRLALGRAATGSVFRVAVGYVSEEGVHQLAGPLRRLIERGGSTEIIVGLNQATADMVAAVRSLADMCGQAAVYVFYDRRATAFHPKVYTLIERSGRGHLWIGSSNLTRSGLSSNYECNLHLVVDPGVTDSVIAEIDNFFASIRAQTCCRAATTDLVDRISEMVLADPGTVDRPLRRETRRQLDILFGPTTGRRPRVSHPAFVMVLARNDVAGRRGEPYFLIPIKARDTEPRFWGWPYRRTHGYRFPSTQINADVVIGQRTTGEHRRIYFVEGRDELRFVSPTIYRLGTSYAGSLLLIESKTGGYRLTLIARNDRRFSSLLRYATNISSNQKMWGYI